MLTVKRILFFLACVADKRAVYEKYGKEGLQGMFIQYCCRCIEIMIILLTYLSGKFYIYSVNVTIHRHCLICLFCS